MDPTAYKKLTTKRGITYNYYASSPPDAYKPTLLFMHGFPSTSYDWRNQVSFFEREGYSIIAPDLLGYGGTDKPLDPEVFRHSKMTADIVEILDAEGVGKAIAIGHDWGCALTSRLASYYPKRFIAFAFLAVGYAPTFVGYDYQTVLARTKKMLGYETYGYWEFLSSEGAAEIIKDHWESFWSLAYTSQADLWQTDFCPRGALKSWLLADRKAPLGSYLTEKDKETLRKDLLSSEVGIASALSWYKVMVFGINADDDQNIPRDNKIIQQPVFFGGCKRDRVCVPAMTSMHMRTHCPNLTYKEFETGHWVQLEAADDVNAALQLWINTLKAKL